MGQHDPTGIIPADNIIMCVTDKDDVVAYLRKLHEVLGESGSGLLIEKAADTVASLGIDCIELPKERWGPDWQARAEAAEAKVARLREWAAEGKGDNHHNAAMCPYCAPKSEVARLTMLSEQLREFAHNVVNQAADLKTGPHHIEGPFWDLVCWLYDYGTEQVSACDALVVAAEEWRPTPDAINALPGPLRQYIHDLETRCDPAGEVAALTLTRDQNSQLVARAEVAEAKIARAVDRLQTWPMRPAKTVLSEVAEILGDPFHVHVSPGRMGGRSG